MPDRAGTHEATGEGVTKLVIALPHGGSVTVQLNPYLVIEHPIIRCVLMHYGPACGNTSPLTLTLTLIEHFMMVPAISILACGGFALPHPHAP